MARVCASHQLDVEEAADLRIAAGVIILHLRRIGRLLPDPDAFTTLAPLHDLVGPGDECVDGEHDLGAR